MRRLRQRARRRRLGSAGSDLFAARNGRAPPSAGALEAANGGSWRPDRAVTAPTTVAAVAGGGAPTTLPPTFGGWSAARRLSGDAPPPQGRRARAARARDTVAAVQLTALNFNPPTNTRTTPRWAAVSAASTLISRIRRDGCD